LQVKLIFILLAASLTAHATPSDPGKAAIDFLEKVRLRKLDLGPGRDTALSSQIVDGKKEEIARRLDRMAEDLGTAPLELGAMKMDENFAAVLVRKVSGFDPGSFRVFPVAMVRRGDSWAPAPVPASFENVDTRYTLTLRERLQALENWMLREQISDLEKLRSDFAGRVLQKIQTKLTAETLRQLSFKQVSERFLAACRQRDAASLLGLIGGLSTPLPDDWSRRLKAVDRELNGDSAPLRPWRLLIAPEVVRVVVQEQEEPDEGLISIACLDPAGHAKTPDSPRLEIMNLKLTRNSDQLWQINLSESFLDRAVASAEEYEYEETSEESNPDLLNAFPKQWLATHPPAPQPSAESAQQALFAAFQEPSFTSLLKITKIDGNPHSARNECIEAARIWWSIHSPAAHRHAMPLAFMAHENLAVGIYQLFSTREPDQFDAKPVYFEKTPGGWLWTPTTDPTKRLKFDKWIAAETRRWSSQWQDQLLASSIRLDPQISQPSPTTADAGKTVQQWLAATQRGDVTAALACTARLNDARSGSITLQNLGYEIASSRSRNAAPTVTGIYQGTNWTAVGVESTQAGKAAHPLYPVVQTRSGPRIVIEIDLFASGNRGRDFLNKAAFARLKRQTSPTLADDLQNLYSQHQARIQNGTR
jgi:hypothetical protein